MGRLSSLLTPGSIAVAGANNDPATYGGRLWRYLRRDFRGALYAVNQRPGAVQEGEQAGTLRQLSGVPELVVLATPAHTILDLVDEAGEVGAKAVIILAREALGQEDELQKIAAAHHLIILGPNCLGLINANAGVPLSSSISLDRPLRPGPLALVSQSGALMGVFHARATDLNLGLGLLVSTGSQAQLRVEDVLLEIAGMNEIEAAGAYLEDLDVSRFEAAAAALRQAGKQLIVLKGGITEAGSRATAAHSRALASNGTALRQLLGDSGAVVVDDADELQAALALSGTSGPRLGLVSLSGGLGAVAADQASSLGLQLPAPSPETMHVLKALDMPELANPLDLEAVSSTNEQKAAAVRTLLHDRSLDEILLLVNDMPGLGDLLAELSEVASGAGNRLITCSACSVQSDDLWRRWTADGNRYLEGIGAILRALSLLHPREQNRREVSSPQPGQLPEDEVQDVLAKAGIPSVQTVVVLGRQEAVEAAERLGYPVVLKVARAGHRGTGGVRTDLCDRDAVESAWKELHVHGPLLVQPQATDGLEFYVGIVADPRFGLLLLLGRGGGDLEAAGDVAVVRLPSDKDAISRVLERSTAGRWLQSPISHGVVNLGALVDAAHRAAQIPECWGPRFCSLDLNPIVVHRTGVTVVDAKIVLVPNSHQRRSGARNESESYV